MKREVHRRDCACDRCVAIRAYVQDSNSAAARAARGRPSVCIVLPTETLRKLDQLSEAFGPSGGRSAYIAQLIEAQYAKEKNAL